MNEENIPTENEQPESQAVVPDGNEETTLNAEELEQENGVTSSQVNDSLGEMLAANFIEYASYVIKDRAIPNVTDGLKPVQRRILHSLHEMDDGRFHKVANVIGNTMKYHPHGDASIGSALVVLANKEYFIEKQGNFGNPLTGDQASAARYIECRLTPLAREVLFNREITEYIDSYDGRNKEPVVFPAKLPVLLMLGADGIAVGMSTHIMPHNFNELLKAQIAILRGRSFKVYPDFFSGGMMDVNEYNDGNGKIKVRAKIDTPDEKTLIIRTVPPTTTTESLMNSIEEASRRGKIKITGINDYTADKVEIEIKLPRGVYAEQTVKQLYAYTDCETSISTSLVVIKDNCPVIVSVSDVLLHNTEMLVENLKRELEIKLGKLQDRFHEKTLAQIFIENRIYKRIEECETYEKVISEVKKGLNDFKKLLRRPITNEDIEKLLQIQIRRISKFDLQKNQKELDDILKGIDEVQHHLDNLTEYAIDYLKDLRRRYGKLYPRRTEISDLETISAKDVARKNVKIGHDRKNNFVGTDVKNSNKNEEPLVCTEFDRLILLQSNGKFKVIPIPDRLYIGTVKHLLKADKNQVYSMIYREKKSGKKYAKRFCIDRYIMNKEYSVIPKGCIIESFFTNCGVVLRGDFKHKGGTEDHIEIIFDDIEIRSTVARGFKVSSREIDNLSVIKRGTATPQKERGKTGDIDAEPTKKIKKPVSAPTAKQAPAKKKVESNNIAEKWSKRSTEAVKLPKKESNKNTQPTPPPEKETHTEKPKPKEKTKPAQKTQSTDKPKKEKSAKLEQKPNAPSHKIIDEETPFFLE